MSPKAGNIYFYLFLSISIYVYQFLLIFYEFLSISIYFYLFLSISIYVYLCLSISINFLWISMNFYEFLSISINFYQFLRSFQHVLLILLRHMCLTYWTAERCRLLARTHLAIWTSCDFCLPRAEWEEQHVWHFLGLQFASLDLSTSSEFYTHFSMRLRRKLLKLLRYLKMHKDANIC